MDFWTDINDILKSSEINLETAFVRLIISFILGASIGIERQIRHREAGLRTFALICLGSTLAMLLSIWIPQTYPNFLNGDPGRIAAQVLTGIGFLGAGAIIQSHGSIYGLTTAASIWVVAVIGLAAGAGMFLPAVLVTLLTIAVLVTLEYFERVIMISGTNKMLVINCKTATPNIEKINDAIKSFKIHIITSSYEYDYEKNFTVLTYKVNVKFKSTYSGLFARLREIETISQINILT
ncbi:MAG: MgtC/SapB family protein [Tannerella sp.]|jgi:putative Mg2+ transporter-C (MgtC) family protein|nr:MgtC/SapB family protein [Tannerella sp.]